ncbi:DUF7344 domain-containing protein [Natronorubrum aibiense]|uniref:ArsR family transcriptional regulator n=1 Tax=Natronorubrum aibiense TaxID=348826 RepID=A0A5P9P6A4_9EURY|nr:ArsR family transcriptional regulator [Natronorubrum aibiense]QFU83711.1 ArsR family transcriptional regulator [Natronorubrum aibiense]
MLPLISEPESLTAPASQSPSETDVALELLADRQRRAVLEYLCDHEDETTLSDLAEYVALENRDESSGALAATGDALFGTRRRVELSLRHVHLPKLAAADAIDYDTDTNAVSLRERGTDVLARI